MAAFCFVLAVFLSVAFIDYSPAQYLGNQSGGATVVENGALAAKTLKLGKENLVGPFGSYSTYWAYDLFGGGAWLIPLLILFFPLWIAFMAAAYAARSGKRAWLTLGGANALAFLALWLLRH